LTVYILDSVEDTFGISEREFMGIVDFAIRELSISNSIDIKFEFEAIEDYTGFCHNYHCAKNEVIVVISPLLRWGTMVKTIFHELTHVVQWSTGQLSGTVWKGVPVDPTTYEHIHDLPWEIEAFAMENHLYDKFISMEK
jgi:hypothetical protein